MTKLNTLLIVCLAAVLASTVRAQTAGVNTNNSDLKGNYAFSLTGVLRQWYGVVRFLCRGQIQGGRGREFDERGTGYQRRKFGRSAGRSNFYRDLFDRSGPQRRDDPDYCPG